MKTVDTFTARIYVGLKEGYNGVEHLVEDIEILCQKYCDEVGLGLTIIPLRFIYTMGNENGCVVELINYARFPEDNYKIKCHAFSLGQTLLEKIGQLRVSIVCSDKTYLLEKED